MSKQAVNVSKRGGIEVQTASDVGETKYWWTQGKRRLRTAEAIREKIAGAAKTLPCARVVVT